jgi:hypothetical protein
VNVAMPLTGRLSVALVALMHLRLNCGVVPRSCTIALVPPIVTFFPSPPSRARDGAAQAV